MTLPPREGRLSGETIVVPRVRELDLNQSVSRIIIYFCVVTIGLLLNGTDITLSILHHCQVPDPHKYPSYKGLRIQSRR